MEEHERRTAALVDQVKRAASESFWARTFHAVLAGLVGGLIVLAVAFWLL
jgi:cytochrome bd-type quinol oxidase subunit 1